MARLMALASSAQDSRLTDRRPVRTSASAIHRRVTDQFSPRTTGSAVPRRQDARGHEPRSRGPCNVPVQMMLIVEALILGASAVGAVGCWAAVQKHRITSELQK